MTDISREVVDNLLSWPHSGFSVHGEVRVPDRDAAACLGRYIDPLPAGARAPVARRGHRRGAVPYPPLACRPSRRAVARWDVYERIDLTPSSTSRRRLWIAAPKMCPCLKTRQLQPGDVFTILHGAGNRIFGSDLGGNAYLLREGETEAPPEIEEVWRVALETRPMLLDNIVAGRTAGETLDLLIRRIEEAGYYYNPVDQYDTTADPSKTQVHLDVHAVSRSGLVAPRISPLGSDWEREMTIPVLHTFTFEYMIHMPVPAWGKGKHIYIAFHDGAVVTEDGVEFPYPPDPGIRLIR